MFDILVDAALVEALFGRRQMVDCSPLRPGHAQQQLPLDIHPKHPVPCVSRRNLGNSLRIFEVCHQSERTNTGAIRKVSHAVKAFYSW
jgi:hypothetical protein